MKNYIKNRVEMLELKARKVKTNGIILVFLLAIVSVLYIIFVSLLVHYNIDMVYYSAWRTVVFILLTAALFGFLWPMMVEIQGIINDIDNEVHLINKIIIAFKKWKR